MRPLIHFNYHCMILYLFTVNNLYAEIKKMIITTENKGKVKSTLYRIRCPIYNAIMDNNLKNAQYQNKCAYNIVLRIKTFPSIFLVIEVAHLLLFYGKF